MSLDDRLHSVKEWCDVSSFEVCGGKGLVDECLSSSLYLTTLVIIHWALDFPQGLLQVSGSLGRGGVLTDTGWMLPIGWRVTGRLGVGLGSIGPRDVRGKLRPQRILDQILQV
jgi:hypothetical protein